jgi:hypothetical protein
VTENSLKNKKMVRNLLRGFTVRFPEAPAPRSHVESHGGCNSIYLGLILISSRRYKFFASYHQHCFPPYDCLWHFLVFWKS